ncbi:hypothetical protein F4860DRAFT_112058 [Xylaria cubensis]|nr:hypothetical protein F4860DRAFT_112058 [Xylaria cubensis]
MDRMSEAQINDRATRTIINNNNHVTKVIIPDADKLSRAEITAVYYRALQFRNLTLLDANNDINMRDITPPPWEDAVDVESRLMEAQARQDLIDDDCPPCYPSHLEIPVRNPPPEYQAIVSYWRSLEGTGDVVLCAQRSDWRRFRDHQTWQRGRYGERKFHRYVARATERRQRYGMPGHVRFLFERERQSQLETWTEYQDYQLIRHEALERERDECRPLFSDLETCILRVQRHRLLLAWTEQRRLTMEPAAVFPGSRNAVAAPRPFRNTPAREDRARRANATSILGGARVSKTAPAKRGAQVQKTRRVPRPQCSSAPALVGTGNVTTRSGRVSRPPVRWTPGLNILCHRLSLLNIDPHDDGDEDME